MQAAVHPPEVTDLIDRLGAARHPFVLTGAGVSTESGIPDYRARDGRWKRGAPIQYREFTRSAMARRRYWARSFKGWPQVAGAAPNGAHHALARLEAAGRIGWLVTQNVDGLHQRAGSRQVTDLHGRLDRVVCMECGLRRWRDEMQEALHALNPDWMSRTAATAPDGDVELEGADYAAFRVPDCPACGGVLKPEVVFFGESVPASVVAIAFERLDRSDALLVAGSSLMVWSGYRFVRHAARRGIPVLVVNLGETRGDREADLKVDASCGPVLETLADLWSGTGARA